MLISQTLSAQQFFLFAGTYTNGSAKGIYVYSFDARNGTISEVSVAENVENPSYLALSPDGRYLFAVNETGGEKPGQLSAFSFNKNSAELEFINKVSTSGDHPCYVDVDRDGKYVVAGNYTGGNLAIFPFNGDSLQQSSQVIQHTGSSANKMRQEKAHVHATVFSPDNKYVFVPDLGMDKVMIYPFDASANSPLNQASAREVSSTAGSGPRHITFHPNGKFAYLVEEMAGAISTFSYKDGNLRLIQHISTHPRSYKGAKGSADIHVSPDGKFLYASNRGESNTIAIFSIDGESGKIRLSGFQSTGGSTPRNFVIDPTGNFLLVANQQSNNIVVFKRNIKTGMLEKTGTEVQVNKPVCLKFLEK